MSPNTKIADFQFNFSKKPVNHCLIIFRITPPERGKLEKPRNKSVNWQYR